VDAFDLLGEPDLLDVAGTGTAPTRHPAVERRCGDLQHPEDGLDPEAVTQPLHQRHDRRRVGSSSWAKTGARRLEDVVGAPQLSVLIVQPQLLQLLCGQPVIALAAVGLVLADPVAQGFGVHAQLAGQVRDRPAGLLGAPQPHRSLLQLHRVLAWCHHRSSLL